MISGGYSALIAAIVGIIAFIIVSSTVKEITNPTAIPVAPGVTQTIPAPTVPPETIPQAFGSPVWVLAILAIAVVALGVTWYIGHRRKFGRLGEADHEANG